MDIYRISDAVRETHGELRSWFIARSVNRYGDDKRPFKKVPKGEIVRTPRGVAYVRGDGLIQAWGRMKGNIEQYAALERNDITYVMYLDRPNANGWFDFFNCNVGLLVVDPSNGTVNDKKLTEISYCSTAPRVRDIGAFLDEKIDTLVLEESYGRNHQRWAIHILDLDTQKLRKDAGFSFQNRITFYSVPKSNE